MQSEQSGESTSQAGGTSSVTSSLLALIVEQSGEGILVVDPSGQVRLFNAEAERQFGVSRETAMEEGWAVNLPLLAFEDHRPLTREEMPVFRALQGERTARMRWRSRNPDGSMRTFSGTAAPLISREGDLLGAVLITRDESEQDALEQALHAEEVAFHRVMDSSLMGLLLSDDSGRIVEANSAFLALIGATSQDLAAGRLTWERISPREEEGLDARTAEELDTTGVTSHFEREFIRLDGRRVPVLMGSARIEEKHRTITFVLDLTGRRRAERSLQLLSETSRLLADAFDEPSLRFNQIAGLATAKLFDLCLIELVPEHPEGPLELLRVAASHRDPYVALRLEEVFAKGSGTLQLEVARTARGRVISDLRGEYESGDAKRRAALQPFQTLGLRSVISLPMRAHGQTLGVLTMGRTRVHPRREETGLVEELARRLAVALDNAQLFAHAQAVTRERQQALEEARHAEWWARFLAEASRIFNSSLDVEEILQQLSRLAVPTLADFCGVDLLRGDKLERVAISHVDPARVEEGWAFSRIYPTDLKRNAGLARVVQTGQSERVAHFTPALLNQVVLTNEQKEALARLQLKSYLLVPLIARDRTIGVLLLVFTEESGRTYSESDVRMAEDLAQRAALAADNGNLYRQSQEAIRVRDEFLSIASHELKTPLTPLQLRVDSMLRLASRSGDSYRTSPETLESMRRQVRRLSSLVDGLLDVSRIRSGRMELQIEEVDLVPVVAEVVQRFSAEAAQAGCEVTLDAPAPVRGSWDPVRLDQIVTNLFTNAIKYGARKPVRISIRKEGTHARLRVQDEGIGISRQDVKRIFGRFERAVSDRHYGGLGLGLYITRQIVQALGGDIRVESEPGQGALFEVTLPLPPEHVVH